LNVLFENVSKGFVEHTNGIHDHRIHQKKPKGHQLVVVNMQHIGFGAGHKSHCR
jgi:hypothetical protein